MPVSDYPPEPQSLCERNSLYREIAAECYRIIHEQRLLVLRKVDEPAEVNVDVAHIHHGYLAVVVRKERHQTVRVAVLYQQKVLAVVNVGLYGDYRRIASGEAGYLSLTSR